MFYQRYVAKKKKKYIVNMIIILMSTSESNISCRLKVSVRSAAILLSLLK